MITDILKEETKIIQLEEIKGFTLQELSNVININKDTLSVYNNWFLFDGELYYFKNKTSHDAIINEFVGKKVSEHFELKNVDYEFAEHKSMIGIASKNFRKENTEYFNGGVACFENKLYYNDLANIEKLKVLYSKRSKALELINETKRLIARDIYAGESDRHANNIVFCKNNCGYHLDSLFDNEFEFFQKPDSYHNPFVKIKLNDKSFISLLESDPYLREQMNKIKYIDMDKIINDVMHEKCIKIPDKTKDRLLFHDEKQKKTLQLM